MPLRCVASLLLAGCCQTGWYETAGDDALGAAVLTVSGDSLDDVWVAGGGLGSGGDALLMQHTADGWRRIDTGFEDSLWWVWRAGPDDVFAVGEGGTIVRWDGTTLTPMESGTTDRLWGVWGSSATDVWVVGGDAVGAGETDILLHFDGTEWTRETLPETYDAAYFKVWGSASDDVWVVGQAGLALHYDGAAWTRVDTGVDVPLFTVHGRARDDVWAVGGPAKTVIHYDGSAWTEVADIPRLGSILNGVYVDPAGGVLVVGDRGLTWRREPGSDVFEDQTAELREIDLHAAWVSTNGESRLGVGGNFMFPGAPMRIGAINVYGCGADPAP